MNKQICGWCQTLKDCAPLNKTWSCAEGQYLPMPLSSTKTPDAYVCEECAAIAPLVKSPTFIVLSLDFKGEKNYLQKDSKIVLFNSKKEAYQSIVYLYDCGYIEQNMVGSISVEELDYVFGETVQYSKKLF